MNFKPSYLVRALCAVAAFGALSGTASASCPEIEKYVLANRQKVESALFEHYGDSEKRVKLGKNNGNYTFMTIKGGVDVEGARGCLVQIKVSADKNRFSSNPVNPQLEKRDGSVHLELGFSASNGTKLCVDSNRVRSANWRDEGGVKEKIFVNNNKSKKYFSGCLF